MSPKELQELIRTLAKTPKTVAELVDGFSEKSLRERKSPSEFSAIEHVCHLRDIEREGYMTRITKLLNENEPLLPDIDGDRLAVERQYIRQDQAEALQVFATARDANVHVMQNLTIDELTRTGKFEGVGTISLEQLLCMMREHDREHIGELRELSARLPLLP